MAVAEKMLFWEDEFYEVAKSIEFDDDIVEKFNAECLGRVDDLFTENPYGYRAWAWIGEYKNRPILIISWDLGNSHASVIDYMYPTPEEIEELKKRSTNN